jgi:beta-galactosidase
MLKLITLCLVGAIALSFSSSSVRPTSRTTLSFDAGWLFFKGDVSDAENPSFNDSAWRKLDVPHDWSIEGPFDKNNSTRGSGGFLPSGVGWYRKHFTLPTESVHQRVFIDFDGVMANSDVWINGFHLGNRPYGLVSFITT